MGKELTKKIAYEKLQNFFKDKPLVLFGTGTSCAVDHRFGMEALKEQLLKEVAKIYLTHEQQIQWKKVIDYLLTSNDLESAMNAVSDDNLITHITNITAEFISSLDNEYAIKIYRGEISWPPLRIIKQLVNGILTGTDRKLHIATPNYDLLGEYAFEQANIPYITGFTGGICRSCDWEQCERSVTCSELTDKKTKPPQKLNLKKHIRLYKVHGSLNTFKVDSRIVENNAWIRQLPERVERLIITPGTSKFEKLHDNRKELLGPYDHAVQIHNAFLFIGFGFNDSQICNNALKEKLKKQKCPGLIITRDTNDKIMTMMSECDNLWLVCKHEDSRNENTRIYNRQFNDWLYLNDTQIWRTDEFVKVILSGD